MDIVCCSCLPFRRLLCSHLDDICFRFVVFHFMFNTAHFAYLIELGDDSNLPDRFASLKLTQYTQELKSEAP